MGTLGVASYRGLNNQNKVWGAYITVYSYSRTPSNEVGNSLHTSVGKSCWLPRSCHIIQIALNIIESYGGVPNGIEGICYRGLQFDRSRFTRGYGY